MKRTPRLLFALLFALLAMAWGCARQTAAPAPSVPADAPAVVELAPAETPALSPAPTATPDPDPLTAHGAAYSFAWLSDTQHYSRLYPDIYYEMTAFLAREQARLKLKYVVHTGDLVHNFGQTGQWLVADGAMRELGDLPYGVLAGNHDVNKDKADYTYYSQYFGEARFAGSPSFGGSYQDNRGHFDLITAGETDYLFAYMGYPVDEAGAAWLCETFAAYPARVGVLCVHDYFDTDCTLSEQGQLLYDSVVRECENVYMVLCGHRYNCRMVPAVLANSDGSVRTIYQMIANYQAAGDEGGLGYLRVLQIDEQAGTLRAMSYSPLVDDYVYFDEPGRQSETYPFEPEEEFITLPIPWRVAPPA